MKGRFAAMAKLTPPVLRGDTWYLVRRVPGRYAQIEPRQKVRVSLATDSREVADAKAPMVWQQMIEAWEARLAGDTSDAQGRFDAAKDIAQSRGFRYLPAAKVARLPIEELVNRIEASVDSRGNVDPVTADALLGAVQAPELTVSKALDKFYEVEAVRVKGKSADQLRRHKAPRLKATRNFIKVVGDKPLDQITTRDLFDFRQWWQKRVTAGEVEPATANKDMVYLIAMWKPVARDAQLSLKINTDGVMFDEGKKKTRPPFSPAWIKDKLLPGIIRMNGEARGIIELMVNTGARPSELSALNHETICIDADVPYIHIRPEGRTLKSQFSERFIPLVGISLEAAKRNRAGFPTYADNPALSDTVNKYFEENALKETPRHTFYSLRHSFESRMLKADFPERLKAELMGHRIQREKYGEIDLEHVRGWLLKIAI
tara:strand:+ start:4800 stop:6092 length:1293 start_codon:yes stop_codon:yes gene_type:complete